MRTRVKVAAGLVCATVALGTGTSVAAGTRDHERIIADFESLQGWSTSGREATVRHSRRWVKRGRHSLNFHVEIDHHDKDEHPMGWPGVGKEYDRPMDLATGS